MPSAAIRLKPNITRFSTKDATNRPSPLVRPSPSGSRATSWEKPQALSASRTSGEDGEGAQHLAARRLAQRQGGDGEHGAAGHGRSPPARRMSSSRSSRLTWPGSTACTRTPSPTRSATRAGTTPSSTGPFASAASSRSAGRVSVQTSPDVRHLAGLLQPGPRRGADAVEPQPHLAPAEQLGERPGGGDPPPVQDHHPVADPLDLADEVGVEQHRHAAGPEREHDVAHVGPSERVERARRLVEHDELGPGHQRDRQAEPLLHALGEAAHPVARPVRQAHERQRLLPLVGRDVGTGEAHVQAQHLGRA